MLGLKEEAKDEIKESENAEEHEDDEVKAQEEEEEEKKVKAQEDEEENPEKKDEEALAAFITSNPAETKALIDQGAQSERLRIKSILDSAELYPHNQALVNKSILDSTMNGGSFLVAAMKASKAAGTTHVRKLNQDAEDIPDVNSQRSTASEAEKLEEMGTAHAKSMVGGKN